MGRDSDVGVVEEKVIMPGMGCKLNQGADLAVGSKASGTLDKLNGMSGKFAFELFDCSHGGVGKRGNSEEQFNLACVGLAAVAAEGVDHAQVHFFEGLEDADAGRKGRQRGAPGH